ncbi:hypothetical protein [Agrobacterium sp. NPDC090283]|uniref:hypothetical protein n=1 Tax=Agrobacterium sp. NPDC090283 TaxID=3363920 RepID=UPI00383B9C29
MQKIVKFLPALLWVVAAAVVFPLFAPTAYNALLFCGRLAAALMCLGLAFVAFRTRAQWLVPQLAASVVAIGAANYVSGEGFKLITPSEAHMLTLVKEGLEKQGPQAVAEYTDLAVSGSECDNGNGTWDCRFNLSYKMTSTGKTFDNESQYVEFEKGSGKISGMLAAEGCELDFQWTQRFRASSYYSPAIEPVRWSSCNVNDNNKAYKRNLFVRGGGGLSFLLTKGDPAAQLTLEPYSLWYAKGMVKDKTGASDADCAYAPGNQLEVRCTVQGEKVVWEGTTDIFQPKTQLKTSVTKTVVIVPKGDHWAIKE